LQLTQWFLRRRFLCEFPIGSYVKLSSAVGAILIEGPNHRTHFWKRTIQWLVTVNFLGLFFQTGKIFFGLTRFSCLSVRMTDNFSASFGKSAIYKMFSVLFKIVYVMSFIVCVSSFVVLMTLYYRSMVVWKTSCHWLIYIQITNQKSFHQLCNTECLV
jgi:hypothetical protein